MTTTTTKNPLDTTAAVRAVLVTMSPERVVKTYSGRPGCACGCKGSYTDLADDPKALAKAKRKIATMLRALNTWGEDEGASGMVRSANPECVIPEGFISVATPNRQNTIYFI